MEDPDNTHILAKVTTFEEAKQEISRLLEFQKKAYYFLGVFCSYDIGEPLIVAKGHAKVLKEEDLSEQQQSDSLETVLNNHERIGYISRVVKCAARAEEGGKKRFDFLKTSYPFETLDINSILEDSIQQIKEKIERQNYHYAHAQGDEKSESVQVKVSLIDNLPTAQCNSSMFKDVLFDLVWFMTDIQNLNTEVAVITDFDEQWVKVIFRCSSLYPHRYVFVLKEFERFDVESTFFSFHPVSLFLYNSWKTLKMYDGVLDFSVQDNTETRTPSIIETTVYLKR